MFSRPGVCLSLGGPRWDPPPSPPIPVPAPRGFGRVQRCASPPHLRSRPAAAPGCPAARSEPAPPPARAWPTSSSSTAAAAAARLNSARRAALPPRSRPCSVAPHWRVALTPSYTPRSHWSTRAGAQTGGSTLPFPIGWWRLPPSALDSCRPLIEAGPAAGNGGGGGGSGPVAILDRGSRCVGGRRLEWDPLNCSGPHARRENPVDLPAQGPDEGRRSGAPGSAATQQGRQGARPAAGKARKRFLSFSFFFFKRSRGSGNLPLPSVCGGFGA